MMKELLEREGVSEGATGSPKQILKAAYQVGMISDEELWMSALTARNNVSHSYNRVIALDIIRGAKEKYYGMFERLKNTVEAKWL